MLVVVISAKHQLIGYTRHTDNVHSSLETKSIILFHCCLQVRQGDASGEGAIEPESS